MSAPGANWTAEEQRKLVFQRDTFGTEFTYLPDSNPEFQMVGKAIDPTSLPFEIQPQYVVRWVLQSDFDRVSVRPAKGDRFSFNSLSFAVVDVRYQSNGAVYLIGDQQ